MKYVYQKYSVRSLLKTIEARTGAEPDPRAVGRAAATAAGAAGVTFSKDGIPCPHCGTPFDDRIVWAVENIDSVLAALEVLVDMEKD